MPTDENDKQQQDKPDPIPAPRYDDDEDWVKEHKAQFGEEPTFF